MSQEPLLFTLSRAFRLLRRRLDERLKPEGITYSTWVTLAYLERGGEGMLQRELADFMGIEAPTLVRSLDTLERDGLIRRRAAAHDRRAKTVHIDPEAQPILETFNRVAAETRERLLHGIDAESLATCHRVLSQITANAQQLATPADE